MREVKSKKTGKVVALVKPEEEQEFKDELTSLKHGFIGFERLKVVKVATQRAILFNAGMDPVRGNYVRAAVEEVLRRRKSLKGKDGENDRGVPES